MKHSRKKSYQYQTTKLPKRSKTIPVKGYGKDNGRYFRCWNCGFVDDKDRNALGGSKERSGQTYGEAILLALEPSRGVLGGSINHFHTVVANNGNGVKHEIIPVDTRGCSFCGTLNWRGDY